MFPEFPSAAQLPTTKELLYVQAALDTGSFSAAAAICEVKPQTVAKAVNSLERKLGERVAFFDRTKGSALGQNVVGSDLGLQVERVLHELNELMLLAATFESERPERGATMGCYPVHLARYARLFGGQDVSGLKFRQVARELVEGEHQGLRLLLNGSIDLVIAPQTAFPSKDNRLVEKSRLYRWECVAYGPAAVDLREEDSISVTRLVGRSLLVTPKLHSSRKALNRVMNAEARRRPNVLVESSDVLSLIRLADEGVGIAVIPSDSADAAGIPGDELVSIRGTEGANYIGWRKDLQQRDPGRYAELQGLVSDFVDAETR